MKNKYIDLMVDKKGLASFIKQQVRDSISQDIESNILKNKLSTEGFTSIQILLAKYLGLLDTLNNYPNTDKALLLQILFNRIGPENIRRKLSIVGGLDSKINSIKNLELVYVLFTELKMNDIASKVEEDIIIARKIQ